MPSDLNPEPHAPEVIATARPTSRYQSGLMSDIVISKCLRAHYLYEAFRAGFTGRGAIMQAPRSPGSSAGERKL